MLMRNSEHRKELISEIRSLAQSQGLNTVFTTFLEITANSLAAQTDPENAEKREQRYQEMASTMTPELLSSYARMLALLFLTVREYRDDPCDILLANSDDMYVSRLNAESLSSSSDTFIIVLSL